MVTALARGLQLLRCFRSGEERLGNLHHDTQTGHTGHSSHAGRYRLGLAALGIGGATLARLEVPGLRQAARRRPTWRRCVRG